MVNLKIHETTNVMNKALARNETIIDFDVSQVRAAVYKFLKLNQNSAFHVESGMIVWGSIN